MQAITKYRTEDGCEFYDKSKAEAYERLFHIIRGVMSGLDSPPKDDRCSFSNGGGYLQHDPENVRRVARRLHDLARGTDDHPGPLHWWIKDHEHRHKDMATDVNPSWYLRMLDGGCRALEAAFHRMYCIDKLGREWGQPYYTSHPTEAQQVCLNAGPAKEPAT